MKYLLLVTFLLISFPLFGDNTFKTFKLECRRLSSSDYERFYPRTGHCFDRKLNAPTLPKAASRPIKINVEQSAAYRIENGETMSYYASTIPDGVRHSWFQIISHNPPHQEITFYKSCVDDGIHYGNSTLGKEGYLLKGPTEIAGPYFIECITL